MHSRNIIGCGNLKHIQSVDHIDHYIQNSHDLHSRAQQCTDGDTIPDHIVSNLCRPLLLQYTYS